MLLKSVVYICIWIIMYFLTNKSLYRLLLKVLKCARGHSIWTGRMKSTSGEKVSK